MRERLRNYGPHFVSANSAPRATDADVSADDLRLYAVLLNFQLAGFPGTDPAIWEGAEAHIANAFEYANQVTARTVADRLLRSVIERATREDPPD